MTFYTIIEFIMFIGSYISRDDVKKETKDMIKLHIEFVKSYLIKYDDGDADASKTLTCILSLIDTMHYLLKECECDNLPDLSNIRTSIDKQYNEEDKASICKLIASAIRTYIE